MPRFVLLLVAVAAGVVAVGCAPSLATPPHLVAAWPPDGATLPVAPHTLELAFNRALAMDATSASVWREDDGAAAAIETSLPSADPRHLSIRLLEPVAGEYRLHWHAVAARNGTPMDGEQGFSLRGEATPPPRLDIARASVEVGDNLQVAGSGFGPKCTVRLTIGDDHEVLATVDTDAQGSFSIEARIPADIPFGLQPLAAADSLDRSATASVQVRWGGWPPMRALTVGQPGPARDQVTLLVSTRNRSDYVLERVRVVLQDPPGATFVGGDPQPQRQAGAAVWEIAMLDRGTVGPFRATYRASSAITGHAWVEFRHRRPSGCNDDDCLSAFVSSSTSDESAPVEPLE